MLRTGGFFLAGKAAADRIMRRSVHRVLYSPMGLYLAKPVGELLASFSSDQDKLDEALPDALHLSCAPPRSFSGLVCCACLLIFGCCQVRVSAARLLLPCRQTAGFTPL